jgi:hypothetical protein
MEALLEEDPTMEANILPKKGSNHWPISFCLDIGETQKLKLFRSEKFWLSHPNFHYLAKSWLARAEIEYGTYMYKFQQYLKIFKQHHKLWNKSTFGNIF